jgi:RNA polymerase sigma-70 factor (ECF subfamily)
VQDSDGFHAATLSVKPAHDGRLAMQEFQKAFDALSPEHREVLILVGASGFSCEEAAGMMGVAIGTVKSRTSRARKRLAELLHLQGRRRHVLGNRRGNAGGRAAQHAAGAF